MYCTGPETSNWLAGDDFLAAEVRVARAASAATGATGDCPATCARASATAGAPVAAWPDESGNAQHRLQADAARQPVHELAADGLPAVRFDGVNDVLATAATLKGRSLPLTQIRRGDKGLAYHSPECERDLL